MTMRVEGRGRYLTRWMSTGLMIATGMLFYNCGGGAGEDSVVEITVAEEVNVDVDITLEVSLGGDGEASIIDSTIDAVTETLSDSLSEEATQQLDVIISSFVQSLVPNDDDEDDPPVTPFEIPLDWLFGGSELSGTGGGFSMNEAMEDSSTPETLLIAPKKSVITISMDAPKMKVLFPKETSAFCKAGVSGRSLKTYFGTLPLTAETQDLVSLIKPQGFQNLLNMGTLTQDLWNFCRPRLSVRHI